MAIRSVVMNALRIAAMALLLNPMSGQTSVISGQDDPRVAVVPSESIARSIQPIALIEPVNNILNEFGELGKSSATAFLISPCFALTASHVVFGIVKPNDVHAHPVMLYFLQPGGAVRYSVMATPITTGRAPETIRFNDGMYDWTLLKLDKCAGRKLGWFVVAGDIAQYDLDIEMAGYPADRPIMNLTLQRHCRMRGLWDGELRHDCVSDRGSSGSPIFRIEAGKPVVYAVHRSSATVEAHRGTKYYIPNARRAVPVSSILKQKPKLMEVINADIASFLGRNPAEDQ